jgi:hypothetical protein
MTNMVAALNSNAQLPRADLLEFSDYGFKLKCLQAIKIELNFERNLKFIADQKNVVPRSVVCSLYPEASNNGLQHQ